MNTNVLTFADATSSVTFANPAGYSWFICLFVFFSVAHSGVPEFSLTTSANLDQLSYLVPVPHAVHPTITMGIWADERKQGTDELLLTIPAGDFDIVLGKYLAAVGIFSVSLLFSLVCNYLVLNNLASTDAWIVIAPRLDLGLFLGTYIGYWLIGLAMLAIGVIASFLTSNITIGFVQGVLLNMPLVFLASADAIFGGVGRQEVLAIKRWSIAQRFADFGHGVLTLSGLAYFAMILVVMLYVSMVLIGRRHWFTGQRRWTLAGHYLARAMALAVIAVGVVVLFQQHDARLDASSERLSSLSPQTVELIRDLKVDRPVQIDALSTPACPSVRATRWTCDMLRELQAIGGEKVQVQIHETERYSNEAALADKRYGIEPCQVTTLNHGALSLDHIFLNVAMSCGVQKVPPVFIDRGIPIEYELVRSICTVSQQKRKKLGVLATDAQLYGSFSMQTLSAGSNWPIIDELEKQYEVVKVDPAKPITEKYDALLAVQPSSLGPQEMDNFVAAVENGQPTAVFEDPAPVFGSGAPATSMPRQPPGGMNPMFGGMRAPPKGDISKLWRLLGVDFVGDQIVWQNYNPYPKASHFPASSSLSTKAAARNRSTRTTPSSWPATVAFSVSRLGVQAERFEPGLRSAGQHRRRPARSGSARSQMGPFGPRGGLNPNRRQIPTNVSYVLAAHIQGKVRINEEGEKGEEDNKGEKGVKSVKGEAKPRESVVNVVVVGDIDMLSQDFFRLREQGNMPEVGINFDFDNVTFVLNVLDELAGDRRFIEIRKRRSRHHTLTRIEDRTKEAKQQATDEREKFIKDYEAEDQKLQQEIIDTISELKKEKNVDPQQMLIRVAMKQQDLERQREAKIEQLRREKERNVNKIETELALKVRQVQDQYKMWAVLLPPIPPLIVAAIVLFTRRKREREGVARSRLR